MNNIALENNTTPRRFGANENEWRAVISSPLAPWVVPIISNPNLQSSARSKVERGKVPSIKSPKTGLVCGLSNWTNRAPNNSRTLQSWANDIDYGFGIRLGKDGLIAIDCDIDDPNLAKAIFDVLAACINVNPAAIPIRTRGTARWATILRIKTKDILTKQVYPVACKDYINAKVEILGDGQQLACCGTHPGGARYVWQNGNIGEVIDIERAEFDAFIDTIETIYCDSERLISRAAKRKKGETYNVPDSIADWLKSTNRVHDEGPNGELYIECPWEHTHTSGETGDTSTVYFPAGSNGYPGGGFKCLHAHCMNNTLSEFIDYIKRKGYTETSPEQYPDHSIIAPDDAAVNTHAAPAAQIPTNALLQAFVCEKTGEIKPCIEAIEIALSDSNFCGYEFAFDTFSSGVMARPAGSKSIDDWRPYKDEDITEIRIILERRGFKKGGVRKGDVIDMYKTAAERNTFDYMCDYLKDNIPEWDGIERAGCFFAAYCGAEYNEWTRAAGLYMWSALYARATSVEGVKCDIAIALVGAQGARKTSFLDILALSPKWRGEVDFDKKDDDLAREIQCKLVMEIPELGNMSKRANNAVKAFLSRTHDEWIPKYREAARKAARRCLFVLTTNDNEFLTDSTGERRWAPVNVSKLDHDSIKKDILQLWAEGRELYKKHGVMWQGVEKHQKGAIEAHFAADPWEDIISEWIEQNEKEGENAAVLTTTNIAFFALNIPKASSRGHDAQRIRGVMTRLGYAVGAPRKIGGKSAKIWTKKDE